jgi:hypothetical protein
LIVLSLIAVVKLSAVTEPEFVENQLKHLYPVEAVQWIEENQPAGELFNEYNWGGYLTWHLRAYPVFVDGRTDLYDDELLREYLQVQTGRGEWEETFENYVVNTILISPESGLAEEIKDDKSWEPGYLGKNVLVYIKKVR